MKYVPSLPPVVKGEREELDVRAMGRVKPVRAVPLQSLSPIVGQPRVRSENYPFIEEPLERRHAPQAERDRRTYCRRVEHMPILAEMRSGPDRRRHKNRAADDTDHVDEQV